MVPFQFVTSAEIVQNLKINWSEWSPTSRNQSMVGRSLISTIKSLIQENQTLASLPNTWINSRWFTHRALHCGGAQNCTCYCAQPQYSELGKSLKTVPLHRLGLLPCSLARCGSNRILKTTLDFGRLQKIISLALLSVKLLC